jgi:hypothetical protein
MDFIHVTGSLTRTRFLGVELWVGTPTGMFQGQSEENFASTVVYQYGMVPVHRFV